VALSSTPDPAPARPSFHSSAAPQDAGPVPRRYAEILASLNENARLFVKEDKQLRRATPIEARHALDGDGELYVVSRIGSHDEVGSQTESSHEYNGYKFESATRNCSARTDTSLQRAVYTADRAKSWDDLDFADLRQEGVPGAPFLPPSGGTVTVSSSFENRWQSETRQTIDSIFECKNVETQAAGFGRITNG
jgi:hypothetical protein